MRGFIKRLVPLILLIQGAACVQQMVDEMVYTHVWRSTRWDDEARDALNDLFRTSQPAKLLGDRSKAVLVTSHDLNGPYQFYDRDAYFFENNRLVARYYLTDAADRGHRPAFQAIFLTTTEALDEFTASKHFIFYADRFEVVDLQTIESAKLEKPIIVVLWLRPSGPASWAQGLAYRMRDEKGLAASVKIDGQVVEFAQKCPSDVSASCGLGHVMVRVGGEQTPMRGACEPPLGVAPCILELRGELTAWTPSALLPHSPRAFEPHNNQLAATNVRLLSLLRSDHSYVITS
jgi:hypothetical protein